MISESLSTNTCRIYGLSHVGVKSADIERSCAFYRDFLGFAEQCRLNYLVTGELMLVCFKVSEEQWIEVFTGLKQGENRMHQIAFRVADAEKIRVHLEERGLDVPPATPKGQMGNFNFVVPDPSGQIIEFVQHLPNGITERDRGAFLPDSRISSRICHARINAHNVDTLAYFYGELGMSVVKNQAGAMSERWLTTTAGDRIECVPGDDAGARFSLAVPSVAAAREKLEHSAYRKHYPRLLTCELGSDGRRFLDLFDPDGTCIRLVES